MGLGLCPRPRPAQSAEGWSGVPRSELAELWGFHGCAPQVQVRFQSLCMLRIRRLGRSRGSLFRRFAPYTQTRKSQMKLVFVWLFLCSIPLDKASISRKIVRGVTRNLVASSFEVTVPHMAIICTMRSRAEKIKIFLDLLSNMCYTVKKVFALKSV